MPVKIEVSESVKKVLDRMKKNKNETYSEAIDNSDNCMVKGSEFSNRTIRKTNDINNRIVHIHKLEVDELELNKKTKKELEKARKSKSIPHHEVRKRFGL